MKAHMAKGDLIVIRLRNGYRFFRSALILIGKVQKRSHLVNPE